MRRRVLVLWSCFWLGLLASACAHAEWSELLKDEDTAIFYDKEAVKVVHVTRYAWTLIDLPKPSKGPGGENVQSIMTRLRVHCRQDTFARVAESLFEKPQGKGRETVVFEDPEIRIRDQAIRPGTHIALLKKQLCDSPS